MGKNRTTRRRGSNGQFAAQQGASAGECAPALPDLRGADCFANRLPVYTETWSNVFDDQGRRR